VYAAMQTGVHPRATEPEKQEAWRAVARSTLNKDGEMTRAR
jgi:hypothetical protein